VDYKKLLLLYQRSDDELDPDYPFDDRPWPDCLFPSVAEEGLKPGWTRKTFIVRKKSAWRIKKLAKQEGRSMKDIVDEALGKYLEEMEEFNLLG
jgi:hypothetical protein